MELTTSFGTKTTELIKSNIGCLEFLIFMHCPNFGLVIPERILYWAKENIKSKSAIPLHKSYIQPIYFLNSFNISNNILVTKKINIY